MFSSLYPARSFEEMRIRYERRDPRPEDIRRIDELKSIVDSQERDIYSLTEQLRDLQLQQQQYQQMQNQQNQMNQQNSNQSSTKRSKSKNNSGSITNTNNINNNSNNNNKNNRGNLNNVQQTRNHQQQQQLNNNNNNNTNSSCEQPSQPQQRMRPPPLIKTVIYEEENEDELYEEQLREERENAARQSEAIPIPTSNNFTVELTPESPDYSSKTSTIDEEISEALIVPEHEVLNQRDFIPSPTPDDFKHQEIAVEVISTIEPHHFQVIPNGLDLELD